jgi:outer membrane protein TolC
MDVRDALLKATLKLFAEVGSRGATTRRIAQEAGVNEVTLFRHFPTKEALMHAALHTFVDQTQYLRLPAIPVNPVAELTDWARDHHKHLYRLRALIRTSMGEFEEHPEQCKQALCVSISIHNELTDYLTEARKRGVITADFDPAAAASMLMGTLFADAMGRDPMPERYPYSMRDGIDRYLSLFLRAIGAPVRLLLLPLLLWLSAGAAAAQTPVVLTLEDALRRAEGQSESMTIASAARARAQADLGRVTSQRYPQINFMGTYDRTLASEFSGIFDNSGAGSGDGTDFSELPFGQANTYRFNFTLAQSLYSAGRIGAQRDQATAGIRVAELSTSTVRALMQLDVTRAFYDAALADRLATIAQSGYEQADATFLQTRQSFDAGRLSEFEVLRAQVQRDNQRPTVIRARANRDAAYLRLRQLLELPSDAPLQLDVNLDSAELAPPAPFANGLDEVQQSAAAAFRIAIEQAQLAVRIRELGVAIVDSAKKPNVSFVSTYGITNYPGRIYPDLGKLRNNWTLGAQVTMPVFRGFLVQAETTAARADLTEAEARLKQARELAALQRTTALQDLDAARAAWDATGGTIAQAARAYEIAELRFREGLSTQLELSDSRLALQSAQANRAQAARDLQLTRARVALLPNLPVGVQ